MAARWLNGRNMFALKTPNGSQDRRPRSRLQTSRISEGEKHAKARLPAASDAGQQPTFVIKRRVTVSWLILPRIEFPGARHRHSKRPQRVQHAHCACMF